MNQKFKTIILWALPIILVIALSYQFLSSNNVDSLKSNGTTVAPRNSAVARVSYGRFLDYINSGRVTSVDIFEGGRNAVIETIDSDLDNKVQRLRVDLPGLTPELINILKNDEVQNYIINFPDNYWQMYDLKQMLDQVRLFKKMLASKAKFIFEIYNHLNSNVSELIVIAPDNFGLFSKISGILSSSNVNIISAKIITRSDGFAIDYFVINNKLDMAISEKNIQQKIFKKLKDGLEGVYDFEIELEKRFNESPSKIKKIKAPIRVYIDNDTSDDFTILEVNCKNAPGVLFKITQSISKLNLQIYNASISTYGTRVTDIFYVKDLFGQKIIDEIKIKQIRNNLLEVLNKT